MNKYFCYQIINELVLCFIKRLLHVISYDAYEIFTHFNTYIVNQQIHTDKIHVVMYKYSRTCFGLFCDHH